MEMYNCVIDVLSLGPDEDDPTWGLKVEIQFEVNITVDKLLHRAKKAAQKACKEHNLSFREFKIESLVPQNPKS